MSEIKVNEIFYSIDGEGKRTGYPSVFIRLTGCNLRCNYCDTEYAFAEGVSMSIDEIISEVKKYNCNNITLTGGEPLLQKNVYDLLKELYASGMYVIIETNGSIDIKEAQKYATICMDWKTPSSEAEQSMIKNNLLKLRDKDSLKIVSRKNDLDYIEMFLNENKIACEIFLSPVFNEIDLLDLVEFVKKYKGDNKVRMQLQIHKFIWSPDERGV